MKGGRKEKKLEPDQIPQPSVIEPIEEEKEPESSKNLSELRRIIKNRDSTIGKKEYRSPDYAVSPAAFSFCEKYDLEKLNNLENSISQGSSPVNMKVHLDIDNLRNSAMITPASSLVHNYEDFKGYDSHTVSPLV